MSVPESAADTAANAMVPPPQRGPRVWKFIGTTLWGLFAFAAMFAGQLIALAGFLLVHDGPVDLDLARTLISRGFVISWSVIMGLPATLLALWLAIRLARMPFAQYLALRGASWKSFLAAAIALWDTLSRALARDASPGFMVDVMKSVLADDALGLAFIAFAIAAPISEEFVVRGFLYRGWSESFLGPAGAIVLSSLLWTALHLQYYEWFPFGEVLSIGLLLGYMRYRTGSIWVTVFIHGLNNLAATLQTVWLAGQS